MVSEKKIFLVFPIVSLWDLSVAMETTILIQSAPKPNAINPPTQLWFTLNLIKICLLASEIFFFEIVDGRRTDDGRTTDGRTDGRTDDDGRRMPAYPISSPVSLRLRWANKYTVIFCWKNVRILCSAIHCYFLLKKCENPLQCKGFSHFFQQKMTVYL